MINNVIAAIELMVAVEVDKAVDPTEADSAGRANMFPCHDIIIICVDMLSQFSLAKYSASLAEMKGYSEINYNQLGRFGIESDWSIICSLRIKHK